MLIFDNVTKVYRDGTHAVGDLTFAIGAGEFVILEGKSGAGKSTIIKLAIKDTIPTSGKVVVDGDDLKKIGKKNIPFLRRKIGVVFQDFKIIFDRTVAENIDLALDILGLPDKVIKDRRKELLSLTGIESKENVFPVQLSGGELQRVAIARAIAGEPQILLADEPTGNLDAETGESIVKLLEQINAQGTTVIMATHDINLVKERKRRTITLEKGKIIKDTGEKAKKDEKTKNHD